MIYLAGPYTHPEPSVMEERFQKLTAYAARLMSQGHIVYSPITHNHPIALAHSLPRDWRFWEKFDMHFLKMASAFHVYLLPGWSDSVGVNAELKVAIALNLPILHIQPIS